MSDLFADAKGEGIAAAVRTVDHSIDSSALISSHRSGTLSSTTLLDVHFMLVSVRCLV